MVDFTDGAYNQTKSSGFKGFIKKVGKTFFGSPVRIVTTICLTAIIALSTFGIQYASGCGQSRKKVEEKPRIEQTDESLSPIETIVTNNGAKLSEGQKKQIASKLFAPKNWDSLSVTERETWFTELAGKIDINSINVKGFELKGEDEAKYLTAYITLTNTEKAKEMIYKANFKDISSVEEIPEAEVMTAYGVKDISNYTKLEEYVADEEDNRSKVNQFFADVCKIDVGENDKIETYVDFKYIDRSTPSTNINYLVVHKGNFYKGSIIKEGEEFSISSEEDYGKVLNKLVNGTNEKVEEQEKTK